VNLDIIKKVIAFCAVGIWLILLFKIFQAGGDMQEQLPKCIFTTIITFSILTLLFKGIEYIEKKSAN
jgi:uncharacterized protein with PQ loop repeat